MKTVEEWLQMLEEPYKSRTIAAAVREDTVRNIADNLSHAIMSFGWLHENRRHPSDPISWANVAKKFYTQPKPFYHKYLKPVGAKVKKTI